jgi:hypothetical protein
MAGQKTLPTTADPDAFLAAVTPDRRREDARRIDALLRAITGQTPVIWGPSMVGYGQIDYRYASGRSGIWPPLAFAPRRAALVLSLMDDLRNHQASLAALGSPRTGVGCIYLPRLPEDLAPLRTMCETAWLRSGVGGTGGG